MIKPLLDNVVVKCVNQMTTKSGIMLTNTVCDLPYMAKVVAIGEKVSDSKLKLKENDIVYIKNGAGIKINHTSEEYLVISYKDILALEEVCDE